MENDKALSMLGICRRAGKLSCGHDAAHTAIKHGHSMLCLLSSDASERLCEEFERACGSEGRSVPIIKTGYTMQEIGHATSLRSAVLTVDDRGFASRIQTLPNIASVTLQRIWTSRQITSPSSLKRASAARKNPR